MEKRHHLKVAIRAIVATPEGQKVSVMLPAGAVLCESAIRSWTHLGMIGVACQGKHYSVFPKDLLRNTGWRVKGVEVANQSHLHTEFCADCLRLKDQLSVACDHYVRLTLQHEQIVREGHSDVCAIEKPMRQARRRRDTVARMLLNHRDKHEDQSKITAAGEI